ncbi:MAG: PIG-L family deacetylase [Armatimonadetes bacterium]|nr:PIG-L family deacetylase [Armatimonadota bacterium]
MSEQKVALAVGAHPDDVEFMMAGTLAALGDAGYELHIFTIGNGNCGTAVYDHNDICRLRAAEGHEAAGVIGATYHEGLVNDIEIFYEEKVLREVTALVRDLQPEIVLTHSPGDYMEDHQNTCRLMVTACFCRGMRNWQSNPARPPTFQDVYLYHANPHSNHDGMRNLIVPSLYVDIADKIEVKEEMLRRHATQKEWLDTSQGMDSYLITMREICRQIGEMAPRGLPYAEGFRQHMHMGLSAADADRLGEVLGDRVQGK